MKEKITIKNFTMNVLNGIALGTVLCLVPGALLGELLKYIGNLYPSLAFLSLSITISNAMIGLASGIIIGLFFKFTPVQSVALATAFILLIGDKAKNYAVIILPPLTLVIIGGIGRFTLPFFSGATKLLGDGIKHLLTLQPIILTILIAMIFACLVVSPITSVGVALAINIEGIASGAANLGICACGFTLAIAGWAVNSKGVCFAHFIGSPKISMANIFAKPKIMLPVLCSAAVSGVFAAILNIQGTPMSAGFGFSGLVGPLAHLATTNGSALELLKAAIVFVVIPVVSGFFFVKLFTKILPIIKPEDYKLNL